MAAGTDLGDLKMSTVAGLVEADRVHRSVYTDPAIFEREMAQIFGATWIYVGHESQIPNDGDYVTTSVAGQPLVLVRDKGALQLLYNRCAHRGAQVVPEGAGNAPLFRCAYHGWIFQRDGTVRTIPLEDGYRNSCFGRDNPDSNMKAVANVGVYRGFVFACLAEKAPPFAEWLRGVDSSIDNMADRSPEGELEITGGVLRYMHRCNWKLFVENLNDLMHPMVTHMSSSGTARTVAKRHFGKDEKLPPAIEILGPFTSNYEFFEDMGVQVFPHGHSYSGGTSSIHSRYSEIDEYNKAMDAAYGAERARAIFSVNRHNTIIYPSLTLKGPIQTIRVIKPLAVDRTLVESWTFRLKGAPDALLERSILYCNLINSSANLVGPDDHEAYQRLQAGLLAQGSDWVSMHRHLGEEEPNEDGGWSANGTSDLVFRNQYRAWTDYMERAQ